jgi:hypothetical protein
LIDRPMILAKLPIALKMSINFLLVGGRTSRITGNKQIYRPV